MERVIACLGYALKGGKVSPILKSRLHDCARLCVKYPHAKLILMGNAPYSRSQGTTAEARVMLAYLKEQYPQIIPLTKIVLEEKTTSTVEQICHLRKYVGSSHVAIVASNHFSDRVRLCVMYIFQETKNITIISSKVPKNLEKKLAALEAEKLVKTKQWLRKHRKGDWRAILREQKAFQKSIQQGKFPAPIIA